MSAAVVIVPVLGRPHRVGPLLASIAAATPEPHRVLFVCSPGDGEEIASIAAAGAAHLVIERAPGPGDYAAKINLAYGSSTEPFLFLGADDLAFKPGWLGAAFRPMLKDSRVGVVGTQDLGNPLVIRGRHATHLLVRRSYVDQFGTIDEPGKVLHEGYGHNFCDTELVATAKKRGAWAFARRSIVEHLHPDWGRGPDDDTYRLGRSRFTDDERHFQSRQQLWRR